MEKEENQNSNSDDVEKIKDNEDTDKSTEKSEDLQPENKIKELEDRLARAYAEIEKFRDTKKNCRSFKYHSKRYDLNIKKK